MINKLSVVSFFFFFLSIFPEQEKLHLIRRGSFNYLRWLNMSRGVKKHLLSTRYSVYLLFRKGNARKENPASSLLISFWLWSLVVWVRILLRTLNIEPEPGITFTITTRGHLGSSTSAVKKWVRNGKKGCCRSSVSPTFSPNASLLADGYRWVKVFEILA